MRLINVETLAIEEFFDDGLPAYAILSHTWGEGEVDLQSWNQWHVSRNPDIASRRGHAKILSMCRQTQAHGLQYAWVDTNCIDKTSSAELSEAINSMFRYYQQSQVCFVFLEDFHDGEIEQLATSSQPMAECRWFNRGWTLQELLAPRSMEFYTAEGTCIGSKRSLCVALEEITGIERKYLVSSSERIFDASISCRMSWAAHRRTTRKEDMAYSLMGIFDINMPLLYGEGDKAFLRLQDELIKVSTDQTIFAWTWPDEWESWNRGWPTIFAPSPRAFEHSSSFVPVNVPASDTDNGLESMLYSMTNLGLSIHLRLVPTASPDIEMAVLPCIDLNPPTWPGEQYEHRLAIPIYKNTTNTCVRRRFPAHPIHVLAATSQPSTQVHVLRPDRMDVFSSWPSRNLPNPRPRLKQRPGLYFPLLITTKNYRCEVSERPTPFWNASLGSIALSSIVYGPSGQNMQASQLSEDVVLNIWRRPEKAVQPRADLMEPADARVPVPLVTLSIFPHLCQSTSPVTVCFHVTRVTFEGDASTTSSCRFQPFAKAYGSDLGCTLPGGPLKQAMALDIGCNLCMGFAPEWTQTTGDPDRYFNSIYLFDKADWGLATLDIAVETL